MSVPEEIAQLVASSGNNFHAKVARWFKANDWHTVVSPYYMDQTQNKAREIDLVAERLWPVPNAWGDTIGHFVIRLFVECKFVPSYSVFWFTDKDRISAQKLVCSGGVFQERNSYTDKHHYLAEGKRVAKLFATNVGRSQETEPYYKALNQVLNGMVSMRGGPVSVRGADRGRGPLAVIEFPVVVCSSFEQMYEVDFFAETTPKQIDGNFQLEVRYAYLDRSGAQRDEYLLLDFVEFGKLEEFTRAIAEDASAAAVFLEPD
jgi:hypothetical protein